MTAKKAFYITTTIPYVNAAPHIGFALEIVQADALARYKRLMGYDVFFNFGSDEHGQKIWQNATEAGVSPQAYVDGYAEKFKDLRGKLNLTYDAFIRTTDTKHKLAAQEMWRICAAKGDIYKKNYAIKYCVGCELEKSDSELVDGKCPHHPNKPLEIRDEENYFFKLSAYQDALSELYGHEDFVVPNFRLNEIRSLISGDGLQDFSISRLKSKMPWGVEVPGDSEHVMYVWFDALVNYISTLGWPCEASAKEGECLFPKFWTGSPECVQVAGKDQVLMSADLPRTGRIFIHGFILSGGQKMSKSIGNVIEPMSIVDEYGTDALRYFLLRHIHPTEDSDFTMPVFAEAYNAGLVNGLGNLVSRVMRLAETHLSGSSITNTDFQVEYTGDLYMNALENFEFNIAMEYVWKCVQNLDQRISSDEPFKVVKLDLEKGKKMIIDAVVDLYQIARLLEPLLPTTSATIKAAILANKKPDNMFPRK
jgi:methionyl-tRNA synthetase